MLKGLFQQLRDMPEYFTLSGDNSPKRTLGKSLVSFWRLLVEWPLEIALIAVLAFFAAGVVYLMGFVVLPSHTYGDTCLQRGYPRYGIQPPYATQPDTLYCIRTVNGTDDVLAIDLREAITE